MTFKKSAPTVSIAAVVLVLVLTAVATQRLFSGLIAQTEADRLGLMRSVATKTLADAEDKALADAEIYARLEGVRRAMKSGDREALYADVGDSFRVQKERFGVRQAAIAVPPATMFLRLHSPKDGIGEDLSAYRPMIVEANERRQPIKGVSISRSGASIVGVAPITDSEGAHLGTIEFGLDYGPIIDGIKSAYGLDAAIFFNEALLREISTHLAGDVLTEANRVGPYVRFYTTHTERMAALVSDRDLASTASQDYVREAFGVPYGVVLLPVKDHAGTTIGMFAVSGDFTSSRATASRMVVWQGFMVLVGSVLCAGVILVSVRGLLTRPAELLARRLEALAGGDRSQPFDSAGLPEELQQMGRAYEALREPGGEK